VANARLLLNKGAVKSIRPKPQSRKLKPNLETKAQKEVLEMQDKVGSTERRFLFSHPGFALR